jgi:hypothetical protein
MLAATFAAVLLGLAPAASLATSVRLYNYVAYTYSGNSADLMTDGVENLDAANQSQVLRLELWAFTSPHVPGMSGRRLAWFPLPALDPLTLSDKIDSGPVPFARPPDGIWYFSMLLTELNDQTSANDGYIERYAINFSEPEYIGVPLPPDKVIVVEFYHAGFDHYFITGSEQDVSILDAGMLPGWSRTGYSFYAWAGAAGGTNPVCRYYIPPANGDSHFFSASPDDCAIIPINYPWLVKESDAAFYIALPDLATGACAANQVAVYRFWNGRFDSNHRYTTSTAAGYLAEGYGPDKVAMCAPN